jgi:cytochrome P450
MDAPETITITGYEQAREAYRQKDLRQALYDDGEVVMADVLVNLHGEAHLARRRLENRLFKREHLERYEREMFPPVIEATLRPHVEAGEADLVMLGHQMMMNLAAVSAGVDRPKGTPEETFRLYSYLMRFIEGATLAHYTGDKDARREEIREALREFDAEFLQPSIARRQAQLEKLAAGELGEEQLPLDVLTLLLRNQDNLQLPHPVVLREVAFFLLASAHTSATAFTRTVHNILTWLQRHPEDAERVERDRIFVQRCVHETVRLEPSSPVGMRWALADMQLRSGLSIPKGAKVVIDLMAVNRDPVFGEDAAEFDPYRRLPDGVPPYGLSFGGGMHACIGQVLAGGNVPGEQGAGGDAHLYGLVSGAVQAAFDAGVRSHPQQQPERDASTKRPYWGRYPVVFIRRAAPVR